MGVRTVQQELERALEKVTQEPGKVWAAGRTDAGVHASGQVAHFVTRGPLPADIFPVALRQHLPRDLVVRAAEEAPAGFHARYSATSRIYRYAIVPDRAPSALLGRYAWLVSGRPEGNRMREAAAELLGEHDLRGFCVRAGAANTVRKILRLDVQESGRAIYVTLEANSFLRCLARYIVAVLVRCATGLLTTSEVRSILAGERRPTTLVPAPPQGLCLVRVRYAEPGVFGEGR